MKNVCSAVDITFVQKCSKVQFGGGSHFEIQYGGHRGRISGGPVSENTSTILVNICAKFGALS